MAKRAWVGQDLWNLLNLSKEELLATYTNHNWVSLKAKRTLYRRKIRNGEVMPPRNPEREPQIKNEDTERQLGKQALNQLIDDQAREALHAQLDQAIDAHNINPGAISKVKISGGEHTGFIKNQEGDIEYTEPLKRKGFSFIIEAAQREPEWEIVRRVESVKLPKKESLKATTDTKTCIVLPDIQFPFQDDDALAVALQIVRDTRPDIVVFVGDALDLTEWSKYQQRPEFAQTTQESIIKYHKILAMLRSSLPRSEIVALAGNHEKRMEDAILKNTIAAHGLRRANQVDGWPVLSVPYLTAMDDLDVKYIDGYPASRYWINERLQVRHGNISKGGNASTAKAVNNDERVSTIFGHVHRIESSYKTHNVYEGGRSNFAHTPGCLCRIDGHVPSVKGSYDTNGEPIKNYENWQHGLAFVSYKDGDSPFNLEQIYINTFDSYNTMFRGKVYSPNRSILPYES